MKFLNLRKAALLSLFAVGTAMPHSYAANPTNSDIDQRRTNGDTFQEIFDWLRTKSFSGFMPLFAVYKYFFDLIPGWATTYFPSPPQAFPGNPNTAGALYASPGSSFSFTNGYVIVNAQQTAPGVWNEEISVNGDPQIAPVPIDGGASLLLAAGAAYGLKRLRRKKNETPDQA